MLLTGCLGSELVDFRGSQAEKCCVAEIGGGDGGRRETSCVENTLNTVPTFWLELSGHPRVQDLVGSVHRSDFQHQPQDLV